MISFCGNQTHHPINQTLSGNENGTKRTVPIVPRLAEKQGRVVVFKNNRPKLLIIDLDTEPQIEMSEGEKLEFIAKRILREHRAAFEELAK